MTPDQLLEVARGQLGVKESPAGSNRNPYGHALGLDGEPWCALFACWVYAQVGVDTRAILDLAVGPISYCPAVENAARAKGFWHAWPDIEPGDQVLYCFDDSGVAEHTGIVESVTASGVIAIEGNTGAGNDTNGGEVMRRDRLRSVILGAVRYPFPTSEEDDMTKRWWIVADGLLKGTQFAAYGDQLVHIDGPTATALGKDGAEPEPVTDWVYNKLKVVP